MVARRLLDFAFPFTQWWCDELESRELRRISHLIMA